MPSRFSSTSIFTTFQNYYCHISVNYYEQLLIDKKPEKIVDEKQQDRSEESKKNHIRYYKSLSKVISDIKHEKTQESDPTVLNHLDERIEAMEKDKKRIREMFPQVTDEEWNGNTD